MKWFSNMRISTKLITSFIIVALIAGIVGVIGITNIQQINQNDKVLYENMTVPISEVSKMSPLLLQARAYTRDLILYDDPAEIQELYEQIKGYLNEMDVIANKFKQTIFSSEVEVLFQKYSDAMVRYKDVFDEFVELCIQNNDDVAYDFAKDGVQKTADEIRNIIDNLIEFNVNAAKKQSDTNSSLAAASTITMVIAIVIGMFIAIVLGIIISNTISRPMKKVVAAAEKIADGDLDVYVDINTKEELGNLANAFNKMANNLNELISNINVASDQVAVGSRQISDSSIALSQGATEQASTIEELTASLQEIATQTKLNAENSTQANSLAEIAKNNAVQGNVQMQDMLKAMDEINKSSNKISKIIKVIDDIAFQTNMLSLNAAVEAARAGQHGKGFAVVAEEVRNLAARSANAAKETTEMIEDSIKNVEEGTTIAKKTSEALDKIVNDVTKVSTLINDIAIASNEQSSGIAQVNEGIMLVSDVVQKNSSTSEETAAASEELSSQAQILKEQVMKFKLRKSSNNQVMGNYKSEPIVMNDNNTVIKAQTNNDLPETSDPAQKNIVLNDKEFGKYSF